MDVKCVDWCKTLSRVCATSNKNFWCGCNGHGACPYCSYLITCRSWTSTPAFSPERAMCYLNHVTKPPPATQHHTTPPPPPGEGPYPPPKARQLGGRGGLNLGKEERVIHIQNACTRKNTIVNRTLHTL